MTNQPVAANPFNQPSHLEAKPFAAIAPRLKVLANVGELAERIDGERGIGIGAD